MQLKNDKIILRYIKESDIENYIKWTTIDTEWQNWDAPWEWPNDEYLKRLKASLKQEPNDSRLQITTLSGEHIGSVNSYHINGDKNKLAIGIGIPPLEARKKGYGIAALTVFMEHLFKSREILYTQTWSGNLPMVLVAEKLGFVEIERINDLREVNGKKYDALTFAITKDEFYRLHETNSEDTKMKREELKKQLTDGIEGKYAKKLIPFMLEHIGDTDSIFRDELIYGTFAKIIEEEKLLSREECKELLTTLLSENYLFYKIGSVNDDSVFKRAFSSLVIALLLDVNEDGDTFLSTEELIEAGAQIVSYLEQEKDLRGYIDGKGWAHSIAHGADMLAFLVYNDDFPIEQFSTILNVIARCLFNAENYTFIHLEDERLAVPIDEMIDRGLTDGELATWVIEVFDKLKNSVKRKPTGEMLTHPLNISNFMKTLYFTLPRDGFGKVKDAIHEGLQRIHDN